MLTFWDTQDLRCLRRALNKILYIFSLSFFRTKFLFLVGEENKNSSDFPRERESRKKISCENNFHEETVMRKTLEWDFFSARISHRKNWTVELIKFWSGDVKIQWKNSFMRKFWFWQIRAERNCEFHTSSSSLPAFFSAPRGE